ncbi:uncharacterized protein LOC118738551 [Rhagoletis pomonella]|uniref:uncharacterized protein LOC118738551 n=1 Tax=Rhagoletis pomonella TaxID=28610 RepID=UPI0017862674|nr:uncharacterized protein LOC118738551 [Rhagoletis pomonella]
MKRIWNLLYIILLWMGISVRAQSSFFRRTYYSPISAPPAHYFSSHPTSHEFMPLSYASDLHTEESKRKESAKKYAKKLSYRHLASEEEDNSSERYGSAEYSNEAHHFNSKETDSREYTIGTQIRVQHPITVPKKSISSHSKYSTHTPNHFKSTSYADVNFSTEAHDTKLQPTKKHIHHHKYSQFYEPDPFHVVAPPKPTLSAVSSTPQHSLNYNVYEPEQDEYDVHPASTSRSKAQLRERFKGVASQKQIEKYLEDQQKLLDEALKLQLLNNPKFQHLMKSKDVEHHYDDGEYEELPIDPQPPPIYRPNFDDNLTFKSNRPRRRPKGAELKRSPKSQPKPPSPIVSSSKRRFRPALVINV